MSTAELDIKIEDGLISLIPMGEWVAPTVGHVEDICDAQAHEVPADQKVQFDLSQLSRMDTAGVWLIQRTMDKLQERGISVEMRGYNKVFETFSKRVETYKPSERPREMSNGFLWEIVERVGQATFEIIQLTFQLLTFLGQVASAFVRILPNPRRWRLVSIVAHMEQMGVNAIPIIVVISVVIGVVLAYQGADQLKRLGVEIYVINLVCISVVREVGILLTAIMVAGRSGSAITAQIGTMKLNQEVDALNILGLDPLEVLVIPRIMALVLLMPLLAFISDIAGCFGGALYVIPQMDVSAELYVNRVREAVTEWSFWVGMIKAPIFGFAIGVVSCFEGLQVSGGAASVGKKTTKSVVESIFLVLFADALLSIFFVEMGV